VLEKKNKNKIKNYQNRKRQKTFKNVTKIKNVNNFFYIYGITVVRIVVSGVAVCSAVSI